jgi:hypothetical protein
MTLNQALFLRMASLVMFTAPGIQAQESLFPDSKQGSDSGPEGAFYELGTVFRPSTDGRITHLRVYALATETGEHTARLWQNDEDRVIGGPYSWIYGGVSGWITMEIPDVSVRAGVDYTVVVSTGRGGRNYPILQHDFDSAGGNGAHLSYPAVAGVFSTSLGARPAASWNASSYLRDILFVPNPPEPPTDAPVRLNEILARNQSGLRDEYGDRSDWIELYNPKATAVDLSGYQLICGTAVWTFPPTNIGPQAFLVVIASAKNRTVLALHTNFRLSGAGEYLALKDAAGAVISEFAPAYPEQQEDLSYGRGSDGNAGFFGTPTPGAVNTLASQGFVLQPVASVTRGFLNSSTQVALGSPTPDAEVRYTLDGRTPTETSALYSRPLTVIRTSTLRARAFKPEFIPSKTQTETYVFLADLAQQTAAEALASNWPAGPVNGQILRYGLNPELQPLYTGAQTLAALSQIPWMSLVTEQANLTDPAEGVYVNGGADGFERPVSLELLNLDGSAGFQVNAGMRIRGGQSRSGTFPKHSFNLFFRGRYGAPKLAYPLFGAEGAREFEELSLRCEHGYAYADPYDISYRLQFTAMRDAACRRLWAAAGYQSTRSRYYHLLLNGHYWGLYQTEERAQEDFGASYYGGSAAEYDAVDATGIPELVTELSSGDLTAWTQLWSGARAVNAGPTHSNYFALLGQNANGTRNSQLPVLLDPHELAAYMLLHYYTGHADEPLSVSFDWEKPNNFRALRRRGMDQPWHFSVHDGESSLMAAEWVDNRANAVNLTSANRTNLLYSNPEWIHEDLLASPEYRLAFADEAQRLLFNDGAFTPARAQAIWNGLATNIDQAVIGESLRWGQTTAENQVNWAAEVNRVGTRLFPGRSATVVAQLRQRNLSPQVDAPTFSQRGGQVLVGFHVTLQAHGQAGTIYFTTDGSDPRAIGGQPAGTVFTQPISINSPALLRTRFRSNDGEWSALDEAFFTTFARAAPGKLIVSKLHYHPSPPTPAELAAGFDSDTRFEHLELQNNSDETLDLRGVQVRGGINFSFTNAASTLLRAGARLCLVENPAGFTLRYGSNVSITGQYAGNLNNSGDSLRITDAAGGVIAEFTYDDAPPWPTPPDGGGPALVLKAPNLDPAAGSSWRPSYVVGGKPGQPDLLAIRDWRAKYFTTSDLADPAKEAKLWGDLADPDHDGAANLLEFALGTSPTNSTSLPTISAEFVAPPDGQEALLRATYLVREGTEGVIVTPQVSAELSPAAWLNLIPTSTASQGDNTALVTVEIPIAVPLSQRFIRVQVKAP